MTEITFIKSSLSCLYCLYLRLILPCLGTISLQTRTKLQKSIKGVLKFQCGLCNESYYGEYVRNLAARSGEHLGISPLTNQRVQPRKDSVVCHHLLNCNYSPTFEDFSDFSVMGIKSTF